MIERINRIIKREKAKHPNVPGIFLLTGRVFSALNYKIGNFFKILVVKFKKDSTFNTMGEMEQCSLLPEKILKVVVDEIRPLSVLDVGCGTGASMDYFLSYGIEVTGIENSDTARKLAKHPERILKYNLNQPVDLNRKFDLVWCFEVIEHIHPDYESAILHTLTVHSDKVVLSAAQPGQGGFGHFNEQLPEYWKIRFADLGFSFEKELTEIMRKTFDICSNNILCFKRNNR